MTNPDVHNPTRPEDGTENDGRRVAITYGDGIGPEIMEAVVRILEAANATLHYDPIEIGQRAFDQGHPCGIKPSSWETIRRNGVLLKAPITTPQGGGHKSLNVTLRTTLGLFANVRPVRSFAPFIASLHPDIDVVMVRENEEDLYAGIEYQQTTEVTQSLKLVSQPASERVVRYAFEFARSHRRRKVTCMTKDNILKQTDGLFHRVFDVVAADYPDIDSEHDIIDIGAAWLAADPTRYDVIVTMNLYGDILSDIAGQVAGSVGLAGSANIGNDVALFEAIHGSAPDIAGQGVANPSGLLAAATQMLAHLGDIDTATLVNNAWLATLESGVHTPDVYRDGVSKHRVGTSEFTDAVIGNLDQKPRQLVATPYPTARIKVASRRPEAPSKQLVGVDVFLDWVESDRDPDVLADRLVAAISPSDWHVELITNRGAKVYPDGLSQSLFTDQWRCRFVTKDAVPTVADILELLQLVDAEGLEIVQTQHLFTFDGKRGYSLGYGQ